jgi:uncharacterized DUF497 family protein
MGLAVDELAGAAGFDWDEGNAEKNWLRHRVARSECEQVFFNQPFIVLKDERHSGSEPRLYGLGETDTGRRLFVVFTLRGNLIRVISARDMGKAERKVYDDAKERGAQESSEV